MRSTPVIVTRPIIIAIVITIVLTIITGITGIIGITGITGINCAATGAIPFTVAITLTSIRAGIAGSRCTTHA